MDRLTINEIEGMAVIKQTETATLIMCEPMQKNVWYTNDGYVIVEVFNAATGTFESVDQYLPSEMVNCEHCGKLVESNGDDDFNFEVKTNTFPAPFDRSKGVCGTCWENEGYRVHYDKVQIQ